MIAAVALTADDILEQSDSDLLEVVVPEWKNKATGAPGKLWIRTLPADAALAQRLWQRWRWCSGGVGAAIAVMALAQRLQRSRWRSYCSDGSIGAAIAAAVALAQRLRWRRRLRQRRR